MLELSIGCMLRMDLKSLEYIQKTENRKKQNT